MAQLRVPSLQHLARNWRADSNAIARELVKLAISPPRFNYSALYAAARDLLVLHVPYDQVVEGIRQIKRTSVRENLLSVLPLIQEHFAGVSPDFYQMIEKRFYPVGRGLMVPFEPPMIYGVGGQLYFPWFSFWRRNPLSNERLSLFVTLVDEVLMQDPDLESARFEILDFSCPGTKAPRTLRVIDAGEIPRVADARKIVMLKAFADGFFEAQTLLDKMRQKDPGTGRTSDTPTSDPKQPGLFDRFD